MPKKGKGCKLDACGPCLFLYVYQSDHISVLLLDSYRILGLILSPSQTLH